jgi:Protein kinase domain
MSSSSDETSLAGARIGRTPSRPGWLSEVPGQSAEIPFGTILADRYRIIGLLGRGGMGVVYRADDLRLGQSVALKFIPASVADDATRLAQFHNEVRVARQVSHRNVCRVYDIGEADGSIFLTMEYVDGEDLASLIRRIGRFPQDKGLEIARQICAGLAAAHEQGMLHRDLKPANIMLDREGRAKITDFGLAGVADEIQDVRSGTPGYMAPEQLAGQAVSVRSDVFALGLVLYEIFTGKRAFDAKTIAELLRMHDEGPALTPDSSSRDLDPTIERVIERCLTRDPAGRPQSALAVSAALPGGDPLAAALAAGETPSPAVVAAAGERAALDVRWGLAGVLAACLALGFLLARAPAMSFTHRLPLEKPPAALEDRARDMLRALGHHAHVDAVGRITQWGDYQSWVRRTRQDAGRWNDLSSGRAPVVGYWYRTSPRAIVPRSWAWSPQPGDPPLDVSGMTLVVLDTGARLRELQIVPPQREDDTATVTAEPGTAPVAAQDQALWNRLFDFAALPRDRFAETSPRWTPNAYADTRAAWTGTIPELPNVPLRVEAAAYAGRPVYFQIIGPWTRPSRMEPASQSAAQRVFSVGAGAFITVVLAWTVLLARRNLAAGRGDRARGTRIAILTFGLTIASWIVSARHHVDLGEGARFMQACASALLDAALLWLGYIALEPSVRRFWPDGLIGWTRMLTTGPRDALVGRDLLAGAAAGGLLAVYAMTIHGVAAWLGASPPSPRLNGVGLLNGPSFFIGDTLARIPNSVINAVFLVLLYVFLRRVLRRPALAVPATTLVFSVLVGTEIIRSESWLMDFSMGLVFAALLVMTMLRFGLLTLATAFAVNSQIQATPWTAQFGAWWSAPTLWTLVVVLSLSAAAFYWSRAGEPLFGKHVEV